MAWARRTSAIIQFNATGAGLTSFNLGNLGAATFAGDRIILVVDVSNVASQPHVSAISSTGGGGIEWARDDIIQANHNGYFEELTVWSGVCQADGSVTAITATTTTLAASASGISASASAYSGLAPGVGLGVDQNGLQDILAHGAAAATGTTAYDSGTTLVGTNKPSQLIVGAFGDAGMTTTLSAGSGFSVVAKSDANGNGQTALEDKDSGAAGFPQRAQMTASGTGYFMAAVLAYRIFAGNTQLPSRRPACFSPGLGR